MEAAVAPFTKERSHAEYPIGQARPHFEAWNSRRLSACSYEIAEKTSIFGQDLTRDYSRRLTGTGGPSHG